MMINLSYRTISMLYPERGEYKTASFPRFYLFSSTGITVNESLNGGGDVSFLNTDYNIVIYWLYSVVLQQDKCTYSVLMKVKAQWAMLFDG